MKKALLTMMVVFVAAVLVFGLTAQKAEAKVTGLCSGCHTMHNSQNGAAEAKDASGATTATPYGHLTKSSCVGCHNGTGLALATAPNVFATAATDKLAGGTFANGTATPSKAHNVKDLSTLNAAETALATITPGRGTFGPVGAAQLTCAGTYGCHGSRLAAKTTSDAGIAGYHHGTSTAYRFLNYSNGTTDTPIKGQAEPTREKGGATATKHNVYYAGTGDGAVDTGSISALCASCHSNFHLNANTYAGGAWTRHPTEVTLPTSWASVTRDPENTPFGFNGAEYTAVTTATDYSATANKRVICLSCHRAHGSDYADLLRFDYAATANASAGSTGTTGCLACHSNQR